VAASFRFKYKKITSTYLIFNISGDRLRLAPAFLGSDSLFRYLPYLLFTSYELFIGQHISSPNSRLGDVIYLHYYWLFFSFPLLAYSPCLSNCHLTLLFPYGQYLHHLSRIPKELLNRLDITSSHILLSRRVAASDIESIDLTTPPAAPLTHDS
jgi:hypothetical protein